MKDDNDVELPLAHIRKRKNTTQDETLRVDKAVSSTKAIIDRVRFDIRIRKI